MMLRKHQADEILRKIKFLHYKFELVGGAEDRLLGRMHDFPATVYEYRLKIHLSTPDTRDRTTTLDLTHDIPCPLHHLTPETFVTFVFDCVIRTVRHEIGELFKVDGADPFNEHHPVHSMDILHAMFLREANYIPPVVPDVRFDIGGRFDRNKNDFILPPRFFGDQS